MLQIKNGFIQCDFTKFASIETQFKLIIKKFILINKKFILILITFSTRFLILQQIFFVNAKFLE